MFKVAYNMVQGKRGWQYLFYRDGADAKAVLDVANGDGVKNSLMGIHATNVFLDEIEVVKVPSGPGEFTKEPGLKARPGMPGTGGPANDDRPDVVSVTVRCELIGANGRKRPLYLRGLPDPWTRRHTTTGAINLAAPLVQAIRAFIGQPVPGGAGGILQAAQFAIRYLEPTSNAAASWKPVASIATAGGGVQSLVETEVDHGFSAGQRITTKVGSELLALGFRGSHEIVAVPEANVLKLAVAFPSPTSPWTPIGMKVRREIWASTLIDRGDMVALGTRDTGRPKSTSRGRAKGRSFRTR